MTTNKEVSVKKTRVSLYIEEELKIKAARLAQKESRSLNNYIQHLLEQEVAKDENEVNSEFSAA